MEREETQTGARELLSPWVRPMFVVGLGLAVLQQLVGINTIIYYAPTIINSTGVGVSASILATVGVGIVNVLFTFVAIFTDLGDNFTAEKALRRCAGTGPGITMSQSSCRKIMRFP